MIRQTHLPYTLGEPGWGWASRILPFMELNSLAKNGIHYNLPFPIRPIKPPGLRRLPNSVALRT